MTVGAGKEETRRATRPPREDEGPPLAAREPTRIGELVGGKYRISRFLAEGGMGVVYEAQHEIVRRRFAVKFLRPDYAHRREFLARFQREAEAAGALESENIASAVDFGVTADGSPFIVMEYLLGEDLAALLDMEGRLPLERAADLCMQACHGAEVAHTAGILHRDLKPKNLFIGRREDGSDLLKILDFGIAKLAPLRYDHKATDTGTVMGTPAYMSPEQARGERTLDVRSDVYALGAILFETLSGQLPHPGDSPNAVLHHIATRPAISLGVTVSDLPAALISTVDGALAADPRDRPQSASALAQAVTPFAKRQVWPDRSNEFPAVSLGPTKPLTGSSFVAAIAAVGRDLGWRRGALLAAAVVLVAMVLVAALWGRSQQVASKPIDISLPVSQEEPSAAAGLVQPAVTAPMPPPSAAAPAALSPSDTAERAPDKPSSAKRRKAGGRPRGRSSGRPIRSLEAAPAQKSEKGGKQLPDIIRKSPFSHLKK